MKIQTSSLRTSESDLIAAQRKAKELLGDSSGHLYAEFNHGKQNPYEYAIYKTLMEGKPKFDRTGVATIGIHGHQSRFNLDDGFPLITTKKVFFKGIVHELLWMLRGETNIKYLVENKVFIWDDWPFKNWWNHQPENQGKKFPQKGTDEWESFHMKESLENFRHKIVREPGFSEQWGELGPVYGKQWRKWSAFKMIKKGYEKPINSADKECSPSDWIPAEYEEFSIDQMQQIIAMINKQHETGVISRRMLVTSWNPADLEEMVKTALPPCHCLFQFHSRLMTLEERQQYWAKINQKSIEWSQNMTDDMLDNANAPVYELDLQLYQRSCDSFLGVPFNIAFYSLLLMITAQKTNTKPGTFIHDYGDFHIYKNHLEKVSEQLSRDPRLYPTVTIKNRGQNIDEFVIDDLVLTDYDPHPAIAAEVAV